MFRFARTSRQALTTKGVLLSASLLALLVVGVAPADAQSSADRREALQQRLQQMDRTAFQQQRAARVDTRTQRAETLSASVDDLAQRLAAVDAETVQARLDDREELALQRLADADSAAIAQRVNEAGAAAGDALAEAPGEVLSEAQIDTLVAAAAFAESITPREVEMLLAAGALRVEDLFDSLDAEEIASALNEIGEKALARPEPLR